MKFWRVLSKEYKLNETQKKRERSTEFRLEAGQVGNLGYKAYWFTCFVLIISRKLFFTKVNKLLSTSSGIRHQDLLFKDQTHNSDSDEG